VKQKETTLFCAALHLTA